MNQELGIKGQKGVVGAGLQPAYHDKERKLKLAATIVFFIILNSLFIIPSAVPQAQAGTCNYEAVTSPAPVCPADSSASNQSDCTTAPSGCSLTFTEDYQCCVAG